jgi:hypothetical protein
MVGLLRSVGNKIGPDFSDPHELCNPRQALDGATRLCAINSVRGLRRQVIAERGLTAGKGWPWMDRRFHPSSNAPNGLSGLLRASTHRDRERRRFPAAGQA